MVIEIYLDGSKTYFKTKFKSTINNEYGCACLMFNGDRKLYMVNNDLHNELGPAAIFYDKHSKKYKYEYYVYGVIYNENYWKQFIRRS